MQTNFIELLSATAPEGLEQTAATLCGGRGLSFSFRWCVFRSLMGCARNKPLDFFE